MAEKKKAQPKDKEMIEASPAEIEAKAEKLTKENEAKAKAQDKPEDKPEKAEEKATGRVKVGFVD